MGPHNRPLDLDWIEDFLILAQEGNFSRAAQRRGVTQPALSRHVRSLEDWVGLDLVDRSSHPVSLTEAGEALKGSFASALQQLLDARAETISRHSATQRTLQFSSTHALSFHFFPQWLAQLESSIPIGHIESVSDSFQACEQRMLQGKSHFLLCHGHPDVKTTLVDNAFAFQIVGSDVLLPVCAVVDGAPQHPFECEGNTPILAYSAESGLGKLLEALMGQQLRTGNAPTVFTAHHALLLKTLALAGRGVAWLPESLITDELASHRLAVCANERWQIPLEIRLYRQPTSMPQSAEALWRAVIDRQ